MSARLCWDQCLTRWHVPRHHMPWHVLPGSLLARIQEKKALSKVHQATTFLLFRALNNKYLQKSSGTTALSTIPEAELYLALFTMAGMCGRSAWQAVPARHPLCQSPARQVISTAYPAVHPFLPLIARFLAQGHIGSVCNCSQLAICF